MPYHKSKKKDESKKQPIKTSKKNTIIPKKVLTTLKATNFNDSKEIYTLEMQILTNYSKGKPTLLTNNMLVVPELDKKEGENLALESYPFFTYKVEYDTPKLDTTGIVTDPEVKVHYQPWCPLSPETKIPLNHNMVVTIL